MEPIRFTHCSQRLGSHQQRFRDRIPCRLPPCLPSASATCCPRLSTSSVDRQRSHRGSWSCQMDGHPYLYLQLHCSMLWHDFVFEAWSILFWGIVTIFLDYIYNLDSWFMGCRDAYQHIRLRRLPITKRLPTQPRLSMRGSQSFWLLRRFIRRHSCSFRRHDLANDVHWCDFHQVWTKHSKVQQRGRRSPRACVAYRHPARGRWSMHFFRQREDPNNWRHIQADGH